MSGLILHHPDGLHAPSNGLTCSRKSAPGGDCLERQDAPRGDRGCNDMGIVEVDETHAQAPHCSGSSE